MFFRFVRLGESLAPEVLAPEVALQLVQADQEDHAEYKRD
jgi:hypothetical protein